MPSKKANVKQGRENRHHGTEFEEKIGDSFDAYAEAGAAFLDFMPLPMTPCGMRHPATKGPLYIPKGKAPFDVYGHAPRTVYRQAALPGQAAVPVPLAVFVGAEIKYTTDPEASMPIVKPGVHGSGLQYHQLDALALVARMGGVARVVWNNGGQVGVLREAMILHHHTVYGQSLASEAAGAGKGARGARSIPWTAFQVVDYQVVAGKLVIDWLRIDGEEGRKAA